MLYLELSIAKRIILISALVQIIQNSRFARTAIVGGAATAADLGLLCILVQSGIASARVANFPSLAAGVTVQFLGNRYWVFRASDPPWVNQLSKFIAAEALSFALNWFAFEQIVAHTPIYYPIARLMSVTVIFFGFSYPLWKWIFRTTPLTKDQR